MEWWQRHRFVLCQLIGAAKKGAGSPDTKMHHGKEVCQFQDELSYCFDGAVMGAILRLLSHPRVPEDFSLFLRMCRKGGSGGSALPQQVLLPLANTGDGLGGE